MRPYAPLAATLGAFAVLTWPGLAFAQSDGSGAMVSLALLLLLWVALIIGAIIVGFLPTFIAFRRHHQHRWLILVVNLLFGASGVGWIIALIWSLNSLPFTDDFHGRLGTLRVETAEPLLLPRSGRTPAPTPAEDAADQLQRLKQLHSQGALTDDEYARARRPLLDRLMG